MCSGIDVNKNINSRIKLIFVGHFTRPGFGSIRILLIVADDGKKAETALSGCIIDRDRITIY